MAIHTLLVEGERAHFLLAVENGTVRVGDGPGHTGGLFRDLRVVRVRCEIEFEDDRDRVPVDEPGVLTRREVQAGAFLPLGRARVSLAGPAPTGAADDTAVVTPLPITTVAGPLRLKVIDGGDQGRTFRLPDAGAVTVGKAGGSAEVGLHDLYVTRTHCSLAVAADGVTVTPVDGPNGTLIDGRRIPAPQALRPGSVLRVGNSHLRLEVGPFTDDAPPPAADTGSKTERALKAPEPEARTVGHYRLGASLGRGHTGEVFEATHDQTGQTVALKLLAADFPASTAEVEAFAREIKAAQTVRHPNLVSLMGAGRAPAGCWVAREYVPGECAAAVVARVAGGEKPSWTRAARVTVHLARALDALHRHHLVHGNITPANVLLRTDDHVTKLADLRMAQALAGSRLMTKVGEAKTRAERRYLAPEQTEPGAFVDESADLYAVGAVAYALVAGRPPGAAAARPSSVYKKVPAAFDAVVMKLLAAHQEDRYPTAAAVLADLAPIAESHDLKLA